MNKQEALDKIEELKKFIKETGKTGLEGLEVIKDTGDDGEESLDFYIDNKIVAYTYHRNIIMIDGEIARFINDNLPKNLKFKIEENEYGIKVVIVDKE